MMQRLNKGNANKAGTLFRIDIARLPGCAIKWAIVTLICSISHLILAYDEKHNLPAMILGIVVVFVFYTLMNSSYFYNNYITTRDLLRRCLKIGFIVKIFMSCLTFLSIAPVTENLTITGPLEFISVISMFDIIPGLWAYGLIGLFIDERGMKEFFPTFFLTLMDAIITSVIIVLFVLILMGCVKIYQKMKRTS